MNEALKLEEFTPFDTYLEQEKNSDIRHEYLNGQIIPIEATTKAHNRIKRNIIRQIETPEFDETRCELYDENVLTELLEKKRYVYPDIVTTCQPNEDPLIIKHPTVTFEILSPSTKKCDKTTKFFRYQLLPSLNQCIFVAQDEIDVKSFLRTSDNEWTLTTLTELDQVLNIPSLGSHLAVSDIYRNIQFTA
ncbi:MAG: Uma2 family endonuclease [Bacteroidota bacterium]